MTKAGFLLLIAALATCARKPAPQAPAASILDSLPATRFPIDLVGSGVARLANGRFEEPAAPGAASMVKESLGTQRAEGDLDGDGVADAAVILLASGGGTGNFRYVAAVLNHAGAPKALPPVLVGDRIAVTGLAIESGTVVVTFLDRAPGQAMADSPSVRAVRRFRVQGQTLLEVK